MTTDDEGFEPPSGSHVTTTTGDLSGTTATIAERVTSVAIGHLPIRGVRSGDSLPSIEIALADGAKVTTPRVELSTDIAAMGWSPRYGDSWTSRTRSLRGTYGMFTLAILEAVLRAADVNLAVNLKPSNFPKITNIKIMALKVISLAGIHPEPLADYLKAIGVLRLVSEQVDPDARGWWNGDDFQLASNLDADELVNFFLIDYQPTPLIAHGMEGAVSSPLTVRGLGTKDSSR